MDHLGAARGAWAHLPAGGSTVLTLAVDATRSTCVLAVASTGRYALLRELDNGDVETLWWGRLRAGQRWAFPVPLGRTRVLAAVACPAGSRERSPAKLIATALAGALVVCAPAGAP